ncbi:putative antibiotic transporter [Roseimaritima multifibrata]|uniref:UPF0056 membrane protein n=1 Tax=Roseimaritima multifibrata TaxID=1930274 RepID=A0A517MJS9_9BACT|nr:MarC family protein [Roseimaritima multifibrata]QDS95151.1 putative antibiotic transporter [Roseimaritima multifibrata]
MNWEDVASATLTLVLIMDPLGNVPVFHAVLSQVPAERRIKVLTRELGIAFIILLGFLLTGNFLLAFLGLTQPSLNIAGGVLLFIISLRMIFPGRHEASEETESDEPFIVPLAVPLIAGPSTIAVLLLLSSNQPEKLLEWGIALCIAWLGTTILLVASPRIMQRIGNRGARAMERLMGMILVILATQMLLDGIRDFITSLSI